MTMQCSSCFRFMEKKVNGDWHCPNCHSGKPNLPPVDEAVHNLDELAVLQIEEYRVFEWHPEQDAEGEPTAVVLMMTIKGIDDMQFGLRLKSARAVNELMAILERHRDSVWPKE